jgi:hypothetical protein
MAYVIQQASTQAALRAISNADRAIVFLSVEWSGPERISRDVFRDAVERLASDHPNIGASAWFLPELGEGAMEWVHSHGLSSAIVGGWGAVAWLTHDQVAAVELNATHFGADKLVERTVELWDAP